MTFSNPLKPSTNLWQNYIEHKKTPNVVIAESLTDINWSKQQISNSRTASKHNTFLEIINEFGLQNMINNLTRIDSGNIIDVLLSSNPTIIVNTNTN